MIQVRPEALRALELIHGDSARFEIRILVPSADPKFPRPTIYSGVFSSASLAFDEIMAFNKPFQACYFTINETSLQPRNELSKKTKDVKCTSDSDVTHRRWLWIDIDPIRYENGVWVDSKRPSNSEELAIAESTASDISRFLQNRGMPEPIVACSGNGYHLLWRCSDSYPKEDLSYRRLLVEVASRFNSKAVDIDLTVDSPGQLCKLYGTLARKGVSSETRKFRFSKIIHVPEEISRISVDLVSKVFTGQRPRSVFKWNKSGVKEESSISWADESGEIEITQRHGMSGDFVVSDVKFDPIEKVESWGYQLANKIDKGEYKFHPFKVCACDRKLTDQSNGLYVRNDGAVAYRCFHASCEFTAGEKENKWQLLRSKHEGVREKREVPVSSLRMAGKSIDQINSEFGLVDDLEDDDLLIPTKPTTPKIETKLEPKIEPKLDHKKPSLSLLDSFDDDDLDDLLGPTQNDPDDFDDIKNMLFPKSKPFLKEKKKSKDDVEVEDLSDIAGLVGNGEEDIGDVLSGPDGQISVSKRPRSVKIIRAQDGRRVIDTKSDPADIYQHVLDEVSQLPDLFISGGRLSYINMKTGSIMEVVKGYLDRVTFQSCEFVTFKRDKNRVYQEVSPLSPRILDSMLEPSESDSMKFKEVLSVAKYPFFTSDGELVTKAGYNDKAKVFLCEPVPINMDSIEKPFEILEDLISDFPFASDAEKQNYLAAWIVPMIRSLIDGPMPMLLLDGNKRGIGKTKLGHIIQVTYGLTPEAADLPKEEEEMEKKIVSTLREGLGVFMFDNIKHAIHSATLDRILTSESYSGRLLSKNLNLHMKILTLFILSVNNLKSGEDLSRRVTRARLVTDLARPERKTGFKYKHIVRHVKENRSLVLSAIAKIVTQWIEAGMPKSPDVPIIGSFESWCEVVGSIMYFHGKTQWMGNVEEAVADATMLDEWEAFVIAWYNELGSKVSLSRIVNLAKEKKMLGNIVRGDEGQQLYTMRSALIERKDSIIGNYRLTIKRDSHLKTDQYILTECVTPIKSEKPKDQPVKRQSYIEVPDDDYEFR